LLPTEQFADRIAVGLDHGRVCFHLNRQVGEWLFAGSYVGNKSTHLWTGREDKPAVYNATATLANTSQRRVLYLLNSTQGQYYGTIGAIDDGGASTYNGMLLSMQRRLANNFSLLANYTLSHCIGDPATTEITGPTYVNPNNRRADRANCDSDRRHVVNVSFVARTPKFANRSLNMIASGWQLSGIVRGQTGNYSTVTTGVNNALTGVGNQRAAQLLADPYDPNRTVDHYLNRAAFGSPAPWNLQSARRIHDRESKHSADRHRFIPHVPRARSAKHSSIDRAYNDPAW